MENEAVTAEIVCAGNLIISIIKSEIAGKMFELPADVDFEKLYNLSERHKVTPLISKAVISCRYASEEVKTRFKKELYKSSLRYETQCKEKEELIKEFSKRGIHHCFLKGQKISSFYPNPEERYMLDMDIYIEGEKLSEAMSVLEDRGYFKNSFEDDKDIGYIKKPFLNVELHRELKYDYDKGYEYYKGAFDRLIAEDNGYTLNMTNEDFYVYILSHCAHHFEVSGTGIRNVLDHYYLKSSLMPLCDVSLLEKNIQSVGLSVFAEKMDELVDYWFEDGVESEDIKEMASFIFLSGVFGNAANQYLNAILKGEYTAKTSSFVLARLFPSAKSMAPRYPVLNKMPFLLPVFWVIRIFTAVFYRKDVSGEIRGFSDASKENSADFAKFMKKNGL